MSNTPEDIDKSEDVEQKQPPPHDPYPSKYGPNGMTPRQSVDLNKRAKNRPPYSIMSGMFHTQSVNRESPPPTERKF